MGWGRGRVGRLEGEGGKGEGGVDEVVTVCKLQSTQ